MELIIKENRARFDANVIKAGYAIYGKHASWDEGKTGIVTAVTDTTLVALFHPGIGNVINHWRGRKRGVGRSLVERPHHRERADAGGTG